MEEIYKVDSRLSCRYRRLTDNMSETLLNVPGTFAHSVKSVLNKSAEFASKVPYSILYYKLDLCYNRFNVVYV